MFKVMDAFMAVSFSVLKRGTFWCGRRILGPRDATVQTPKRSAEIPAPRLGVCITSRGLVNAFAVPHPHRWNWITAGLSELL